MDAFLKKLKAQGGEYANIGTSFSSLTEQQRIYVRYAAIMDQFTSKGAYSAENYAKSLRTITGSLSILNSQLRGLKSDIGALALQLFAKIVQPLIYVIYLIRTAIRSLAELLGIDISLNPQMNNGDEVVTPIEDTTKALEDEAAAADKAKGSLDDLDHVSTMSQSNNKNKDNFDYSSLMNISDDYAKALEELGKAQDDFIEECKRKFFEMLNSIKNKFTDIIKKLTGRDIDWGFIKGNLEKTWNNIKETFKNIWKAIKNFGKIVLGLIWSIGDDLDFSTLLEKFTRVIKLATYLVQKILEKVQPYIQAFYDKYLSPYVKKFGDWCEKYLDIAIVKLSEWIAWWENDGNKPKIQEWFDGLGEKFENLVKWLSYIKTLFKGLFGMKKNKNDVLNLKEMPDWLKNIYDIMVDVNSIFNDFKDVLKDVLVHIFDFNGDGELTFEDVKLAIEKIKEKLDEVAQWVNDNKENITLVLTSAWDTLSKLAELKFSIIGQIISLVVENADKISAVLDTIGEILDFVKENPALSFGIAVGLQVAGKVLTGAATMLFWQSILGVGPGGALASALGSMGASLGVIAAPIIVVIGLMTMLVGLFATAYSQSEEFRNNVSKKIEELGKFIDEHIGKIKGLLDDIKDKLKDLGLDLDDIYANPVIKFILDSTLELFIANIKGQLDLLLIPLESILTTLDDIVTFVTDLKNMDLKTLIGDLANLQSNFFGGGLVRSFGENVIGPMIGEKIYGHANGGVPSSGSLFYANENGNTELVGNFGGYTGVANQDMIIKAMQGAMVQAIRSAGGFNSNQKGNITINVGNWLGDEAGIRKLANKINSVNVKSNSNIANVSFSMS